MSLMDEFLNELEILGLWVSIIIVNMISTILIFNLSKLIEFESSDVDGAPCQLCVPSLSLFSASYERWLDCLITFPGLNGPSYDVRKWPVLSNQ